MASLMVTRWHRPSIRASVALATGLRVASGVMVTMTSASVAASISIMS